MNSRASPAAAASSSASSALAQARPLVTLLSGGSTSLAFAPDADGRIDHETALRCSYCRTSVSANELAAAAHRPELAVVTCQGCVERKRASNSVYSRSTKGKHSIARSRRKHRRGQRDRENERKREATRLRHARDAEAEAARWAERLAHLFEDDSNDDAAI